MNKVLWVLQGVLGVVFIGVGVLHLVVPPGLPPIMSWLYDLPLSLNYLSGGAEILAGLGFILPGLTRMQTRLTPLAALGLMVIMISAAIWHATRSEFPNIFMNLMFLALTSFVGYGRWKLSPLTDKGAA